MIEGCDHICVGVACHMSQCFSTGESVYAEYRVQALFYS